MTTQARLLATKEWLDSRMAGVESGLRSKRDGWIQRRAAVIGRRERDGGWGWDGDWNGNETADAIQRRWDIVSTKLFAILCLVSLFFPAFFSFLFPDGHLDQARTGN